MAIDKERSKRVVYNFLNEHKEWSAISHAQLWRLRHEGEITKNQFEWIMKKWGRWTTEDHVKEIFKEDLL